MAADITSQLESTLGDESVALLRKLGELSDERRTAAYVVGGVVRDALLGIPNEDLDVVVEENGDEFAARAAERLGGSVKAHTRFGTAIFVTAGGRKVDVATARSEVYERPGALPTVRRGDIREDLKRRDFTINSMAARIGREGFGELLDFYSGREDLEGGVLRVLTKESFVDDPTRVLRGVRFAARFGFILEKESERLLRKAVREGNLSTVSGERIMNEICLILQEREPWPPVHRLIEWSILPSVESRWTTDARLERVFDGIASCLASAPCDRLVDPADVWRLRLLAMLAPLAPRDRMAVLDRLRAGRRLRELALALESFESRALPVLSSARALRPSEIYAAAAPIAEEALVLSLATGHGAAVDGRVSAFLSDLRGARTSLDGDDLARMGVREGRRMGEILGALLDARLDGAVTTDEQERALAERLAKVLDEREKSC